MLTLSLLFRSAVTVSSTFDATSVLKTKTGIMSGISSFTTEDQTSNNDSFSQVKDSSKRSELGDEITSIHAAHVKDVHEVPMKVLLRPIPSVLDENKVESLMETIKNPTTRHLAPPIDVMWITGSQGGDYYFSFGGCHRYEAYKRLQLDTIPCKLIKSTVNDLKIYMGSSTPDLK